jgi:cysteine desulfurase / selenocysteine lyase
LPDRLEAGTQNGPGIAGLLCGVEWVLKQGVEAIQTRETGLKAQLRKRLSSLQAVRLHSPAAEDGSGIVTLTIHGIPAAEVARRLDRDHGIQARAGLHCAPEVHGLLGTEAEGALRLSVGWCTTAADVDAAAGAIAAIAEGSAGST